MVIAPWWCWIMKIRNRRSNSGPLAWSSWCSWASLSMPGISISCSTPSIFIFIPVGEAFGTGSGHHDRLGVVGDHAGHEVDVRLGVWISGAVRPGLGGAGEDDRALGHRLGRGLHRSPAGTAAG